MSEQPRPCGRNEAYRPTRLDPRPRVTPSMGTCGHTGIMRAMAKQRPRSRKVPTLKKILRPLVGDSHRRASVDIHRYLRDLILSNALPPETVLSQVEVADCLKVSRTPVREALRMLMEEGLVKAEPNYRCRVLGFDPRELEALYVSRIANEGIAATVTVQSLSLIHISEPTRRTP